LLSVNFQISQNEFDYSDVADCWNECCSVLYISMNVFWGLECALIKKLAEGFFYHP